jgi:hypothetical protein
MSKANDPIVNKVYDIAIEWIENNEFSIASIVNFTTFLMLTVQHVISDKEQGMYKKQIVLTVLRRVINETAMSEEDKAAITNVLETVVPVIIDSMVSVARGDINFDKIIAPCRCLWLCPRRAKSS